MVSLFYLINSLSVEYFENFFHCPQRNTSGKHPTKLKKKKMKHELYHIHFDLGIIVCNQEIIPS
jgi:hypothetical protein